MSGWILDAIEIEGFRGINNDGDPLRIKFSSNAVNSVFAPNGVGKSSIFDAIAFAIRGSIKKLNELAAAERAGEYYVNRFHSKGVGTIHLTLSPEGGGAPVRITVNRTMAGTRSVSGSAGIDAEALLASLDRDFVLLDHRTFQSFMDDKALDRGRSFSGLLGLSRYSNVRQELQALANTRAFNGHFDTAALDQRLIATQRRITEYTASAKESFGALTQESLTEYSTSEAALARALAAMMQITVIAPYCEGKTFQEIVIEDCLAAVSAAEVGEGVVVDVPVRADLLVYTVNDAGSHVVAGILLPEEIPINIIVLDRPNIIGSQHNNFAGSLNVNATVVPEGHVVRGSLIGNNLTMGCSTSRG